jgi:hypothetical protein
MEPGEVIRAAPAPIVSCRSIASPLSLVILVAIVLLRWHAGFDLIDQAGQTRRLRHAGGLTRGRHRWGAWRGWQPPCRCAEGCDRRR